MMIGLANHPVMGIKRNAFDAMTDADRLRVSLRHLLSLDSSAVYHEVGNSTVVYYTSPHGTRQDRVTRIVLDPRGVHRRIGPVGFDPRRASR